MDISQAILSDITVFNKYAKHIPHLRRRENWDELCNRNMGMHLKKYPELHSAILNAYQLVRAKKILPSMRSMQFAGLPVELANNRIYNCAYLAVREYEVFSEVMFLLLGGSGVGYSVQQHHIDQLPPILGPAQKTRRFLVGDSIEGWADAIKVLTKAYFFGRSDPIFDFRDIRPKGSRLITSGGKAPGPDPLRICIDNIRSIFNNAIGRKLTALEAHDTMCHIADAVLSGGIRRAAMIALFDHFNYDMIGCKSGAWYELNPQRGRANNSVVLDRKEITEDKFKKIWNLVEKSNAGEPGIFWTNNKEIGTNPCAEISLNDMQFCNLCEVNADDIESQADLNNRVKWAAFLGTLQAGYTDFHYLRPEWKEMTEKEALIGVGMTGIGSGKILPYDFREAAEIVLEENARVAKIIGINPAARNTTVKPSGTSSLAIGCASGIHNWFNEYFRRRMRLGKNEPLYKYIVGQVPELVEDCMFKPHIEAVFSIPQKAPEGSMLRSEPFIDFLERVKRFNLEWVRPGHRSGENYHNVSCTVNLKKDEWKECGEWMWENRESYSGISCFPYDNGSYVQPPFEDITKEEFDSMFALLKSLNLDEVVEDEDNTNLNNQVACAGNGCEV